MRLRAENEKLKAQIEGLKECVGFATLYATFPNIPKEELMALGKSMMQSVEVEKFLADWKAGVMNKGGMASPQEVENFAHLKE